MFELHYFFLVIYSSVKTKKKSNIRSFCCKKIWGEEQLKHKCREGEGKGRSDDRAKLIQKMKLLYNMGSTS